MKNKITIVFFALLLVIVVFMVSPWTPSIRTPHPRELAIVSILNQRKEFADLVVQRYSSLPKGSTQEVRRLYRDAQLKFNGIIEQIGFGADSHSIPIDEISKNIPDAELAYNQLYNYIEPSKHKQKMGQRLAITSRQLGTTPKDEYISPAIENSVVDIGEIGNFIRAVNEIAGKKDIYESIAKRIEKYRWAPFSEK
ncbi:MAG: hypothetical protein K2X50_08505 [Gammaproteobacteria bacterium]|jgi:hypothetical protein|nr:hypothetical protein [Gammaproteobacteria bacterium]